MEDYFRITAHEWSEIIPFARLLYLNDIKYEISETEFYLKSHCPNCARYQLIVQPDTNQIKLISILEKRFRTKQKNIERFLIVKE